MTVTKEIKGTWKLMFLHLFPGIALSIMYIFFSKVGLFAEFPKVVILGFSTFFSSIPIELGYLFYVAKKEEGTFQIFKILGLKGTLNAKTFILYSLLLIITGGILFLAFKPLTNFLLHTVFGWLPSWYNFDQDMIPFRRMESILAILVRFFVLTLIVPIIEELYFRGFLLARMKWMGKYSVLLNVLLFSVYHFYSPWLIIARIAAMLPLYFLVYKKDSLKLGIFVHCFANFIDVVAYMTLLM